MKFIINSKVLFEYCKMAIQFRASRVQVGTDCIVFPALREISMPVEFKEITWNEFDIKFNPFRWEKVKNFLHDLPDQQVTVQLYEDRICILCEALFVV